MVGVFRDPVGQWYVWRSTFLHMKQECLIYFYNLKGDNSINNLDICTNLAQLSLFFPHMAPLSHILTTVDNNAEVLQSKRCSVITASTAGPLLCNISIFSCCFYVHSYS